MVYFTSDLHFGHKNLCEGIRGISVDKSDQLIISNWNKLITKHDKVFLLGDINMEKPTFVVDQLKQLKGNIEIILGNHDFNSARLLVEAGYKVCGCKEYKGFLLTHIPCHPAQLVGFLGNIHGHIHLPGIVEGLGEYKPQIDLGPKYFNVNTEFHNYTPINFETILKYFNENGEEKHLS